MTVLKLLLRSGTRICHYRADIDPIGLHLQPRVRSIRLDAITVTPITIFTAVPGAVA